MKSLLAGYVRLRSHSRRSLLGEWGAKFLFPVPCSHLFTPSVHTIWTHRPSCPPPDLFAPGGQCIILGIIIFHWRRSYVHDHSNPSDQTTVHYLVSVLARIRFKHLCKCNFKLLDRKKGLLNSCVYQIIQRLATGRFCQEIGTYSCYFSFDWKYQTNLFRPFLVARHF